MSKIEEVQKIMAEEFPPAKEDLIEPVEGEDETDNEVPPKETESIEPETQSVKELADKLGTSAKALYDSIRVPMADGTSISIGELKDLSTTSRVEREGYEQNNAELITQHRNLALIGERLTPELAEQAQAAIEAHTQRELALLAKVLPTWADKAIATREEKSIMQLTSKYGLSQVETEALVTDHRLVKLLRDIAVRGGVTTANPKSGNATARTHTKSDDSYKRAQQADASKSDKLSAISALIN